MNSPQDSPYNSSPSGLYPDSSNSSSGASSPASSPNPGSRVTHLLTPTLLKSRHRKGVKVACLSCRSSHIACDSNRPCKQCARRGKMCIDAPSKKSRSTDFISHRIGPSDKEKNFSWHVSENQPTVRPSEGTNSNRGLNDRCKSITIIPYIFPEQQNQPKNQEPKVNNSKQEKPSPKVGNIKISTSATNRRLKGSHEGALQSPRVCNEQHQFHQHHHQHPHQQLPHQHQQINSFHDPSFMNHLDNIRSNIIEEIKEEEPEHFNVHNYISNAIRQPCRSSSAPLLHPRQETMESIPSGELIEIPREEFENMKLAITTIQAQHQAALAELDDSRRKIRMLEEALHSQRVENTYYENFTTPYVNSVSYSEEWEDEMKYSDF